jgi:hypothetical protein
MHQNNQYQRLVTQQEFAEIANLEPAILYCLSLEGRLPLVKHNGARLVNLNDPRAQRYLPKKDLFA